MRAMVIRTKILRSERVESTNAADQRSIHRKKSPLRTRINTDLDAEDASQLDFFYQLFTPEMFATIAGQTNRYARVKFAAIPSLPCRK